MAGMADPFLLPEECGPPGPPKAAFWKNIRNYRWGSVY